MSNDRREEILVRLLEIAAGVSGVTNAYRNKDEIGERERPCVLILDADEEVADPPGQSNHSGRAAILVSMTPEIYIMLGESAATVGTAINTLRRRVLHAILTDDDLAAICGANGRIRFQACATGLARGRNMEASLGLSMAFTYPLIVAELAD